MNQGFIIKLRNWIIPFKLVRLLVTHDGGKLIQVGKLFLTERLQGRESVHEVKTTKRSRFSVDVCLLEVMR